MVRTSQAIAAESLKVFPQVATTQGTKIAVVAALAEKKRLSSSETGSLVIKPVCEGKEAQFESFQELSPEL